VLVRVGVLFAAVAVAAGCAVHARDGKRAAPNRAEPPRHLAASPRVHKRKPGRAIPRKPVRIVVTVVNGDTNRRVAGARVEFWRRHDLTQKDGVADIRVPWRKPLVVAIRARGYTPRFVYVPFREKRKVTLRIYRPQLQWPLYGATASRAQAQTHIALRPPFRVVWSRGIGALVEFPAVVWNGRAYVGNARATIRAISIRNGKVVWRHDTPHGKLASSPAVVGNDIVYHGMDGAVYVLDRATGRLRWHFRIGSPIESSPIVHRGLDYFGAWNGRVYALDLRRHRLRWVRSLGAKITSSAALVGGRLFIGDYGARIWALDPRNGRTRWVRSVNGRVYGTPAVAYGRVFVPSSTGGSLTAFTTTGRRLWRVQTGAYVYSSPAVWAARVFFGSYNGVFYAVSARSGRVLWRVRTGGSISGAAAVVSGIAYAGSFAHRIVGVDGVRGRVVVSFPHGYYVPVSGDGKRLLFHGFSRIYAVEPRAQAPVRHRATPRAKVHRRLRVTGHRR
jgi:outer membrane protein assembly factor BamB